MEGNWAEIGSNNKHLTSNIHAFTYVCSVLYRFIFYCLSAVKAIVCAFSSLSWCIWDFLFSGILRSIDLIS